VSTEEARLARQALAATAGCARRLQRSQKKLASRFPLAPAELRALPPDAEDDLDAFLKRFEQLVSTIQDEVFKAIAVLGGEDVRNLSRREIAELMERLGAVSSATMFRTLVAIRNRVAHVYPDDPDRQTRNLNEAYAAVDEVLSAYAAVHRYLERHLAPFTAD
jgi:uncharacterized protein YutE (UPF0331/DUF86 family)